jgi:DNA processing protein
VDVRGILSLAARHGQQISTPASPGWPQERFAGLADPPAALFHVGPLPPPSARTVAIVGTREASASGCGFARRLAGALARRGIWVTSGFAVGIDGAAHGGALDADTHDSRSARGARTIAVLATGLDVPYPAAHGALRRAMQERGSMLSEYPPGTRAARWQFPARNRIVAALSEAIVVVEAPRRSGALITAGFGVDLGREILAVPGAAGRPAHAGCHLLIKRGMAALCEGPEDVLQALCIDAEPGGGVRRPAPPSGLARVVFDALDPGHARSVDALVQATGLDAARLGAQLAHLEMEGFAVRLPGVGWVCGDGA